MNIASDLLGELIRFLQTCEVFNNDQALKAVFIDERIAEWHSEVPDAKNLRERVQLLIAYLHDKHNGQKENALILFLRVLEDYHIPHDDARHTQLLQLIKKVEHEVPFDLPTPPKKWPIVVATLAVLIATFTILSPHIIRWIVPPMGTGFNVGIAQFSVLDAAVSTKESAEFSTWLYEAIEKEMQQLDPALRATLRRPRLIGVVRGEDRATRAHNAAEIAGRHNAAILIYGIINLNEEDKVSVQLEFFVRPESFDYGSEVTGQEQLGSPVTVTIPPDENERYDLNVKLYARTQALQYIVRGLAYFFTRDFNQAGYEFQKATEIKDWSCDEGKEVAYLLLGAAKLRSYDPVTHPAPLIEAQVAFEEAYGINPDYARSYLGLGAIAEAQAIQLNEEGIAIESADENKLIEAHNWYLQSLNSENQPTTAYIQGKASYGLGKVHLIGFRAGLPGWSKEEAKRYFQAVIDAYDGDPSPELGWYAAHAYAYQGWIAGIEGAWDTMTDQCHTAIDMLDDLPGNKPAAWIARYWYWICIAEEQRDERSAAYNACQKAIDIGKDNAGDQEIEKWDERLQELKEGGF